MGNIRIKKRAEIEKEKIQLEIDILKKQLYETDYRIIKSSEYRLLGLEIPYDLESLHAERQAIRESAPRTCGDDPMSISREKKEIKCSPHMRG